MKRRIRSFVLSGALSILSSLLRPLSLRTVQRLGAAIGSLGWHVARRDRRKTLRNLETTMPDLSPEAQKEMGAEVFRHLGRSLTEVCWMRVAERVRQNTEFEGLDNLRSAVDHGRGVVLFTGHCGNWEWMAAAIAVAGLEMNVIARSMDDERMNEFIVRSRARFGVTTIGRGSRSSAADILRTLREGKILGVLIDQSINAEVVDVDFLGREAPTPIGPARLAKKGGSQVIAGFTERLDDGRHLVRFEPSLDASELDPVEITQRMTAAIVRQIRRRPEQWVWNHNRWRRRRGQKYRD